ncbi:MAG: hypothetical protein KF847_02220 [Pirellulales bacterium]|nr:hypothetical protein [Pirellulales bacterium]
MFLPLRALARSAGFVRRRPGLLEQVVVGILAIGMLAAPARACPFCAAAQQTLAEELTGADAAVIATLARPMPELSLDDPAGSEPQRSTATFRIEEILSGADEVGDAKEVDVVYFGDNVPGQKFLITAILDNELAWVTPLPLSERAIEYVKQLPGLPPAGPDRLDYFQRHFEDADPLLAQDAYDEFSRAPYKDVIDLAPRMNRKQLLAWIDDPRVGPSSRRLYLTMLGVCGTAEDVAYLEELASYDYGMLKPAVAAAIGVAGLVGSSVGWHALDSTLYMTESRKKESLDALLACYLKLKGPAGLKLVNERYLANPKVEYKYLHAAIMALRFHGEETSDLPREDLLESMRLALDHKDFADQIIPDLTRWQDWGVMDRLIGMFKDSPPNDWIRQPVASYLLVAAEEPGEVGAKATAALDVIQKLDPETYQRAKSFAGFGFFGAKPATVAAAKPDESADDNSSDGLGDELAGPAAATIPTGSGPPESPPDPADFEQEDDPRPAVAATSDEIEPKSAESSAVPATNRWLIIGAPVLGVIILMAVFAALLKGADPRSTDGGP